MTVPLNYTYVPDSHTNLASGQGGCLEVFGGKGSHEDTTRLNRLFYDDLEISFRDKGKTVDISYLEEDIRNVVLFVW